VHAEGNVADRTIVIAKQDGGLASVNLGPLVSQRVIGSLVPMLVQVEKPSGDPIVLAADQLSYPLDGDLSKLDALVRLDLGAISFDFLPGLGSMLGDLGGPKAASIAPISIPIEKGVARYDKLVIPIGGRDYAFSGSYSLVDQTMKLGTSIPLAALGKKVSSELEKVRGLLSPDLAVPIEIRGTWRKPRVGIADDFLKKVLKDAAGNQLEGFLKGLGGKKD
jgi:hypothetical protein